MPWHSIPRSTLLQARIDGSPLVYNQRNVYLPDLLICRAEWAEQVLRLVREMPAAA
jgi:3'(2'), 5'-bisphosphate nucleotidase